MYKAKNFKKIGQIGLLITIFTTMVFALLLVNPLYANASQPNKKSVGFDNNWDPKSGSLMIYSHSWFRQTLEANDVNKILADLKITKADVKKLTIWGMNYIGSEAISYFDNLTYLEIQEPATSGIRLGDEAICFNCSLEQITLGGVEWMNPDGKESENCIYFNYSLEQINITYDNWDKYEHNTADVNKLNNVIHNNGQFNYTEKCPVGYNICSLHTQSSTKNPEHSKTYHYLLNGKGGSSNFANWTFIEGK